MTIMNERDRPYSVRPQRRRLLAACGLLLLNGTARATVRAAEPTSPDTTEEIVALERRIGGRIGVHALDTGSGRTAGYRADERFAMCSTFKMLLAAAVLARVDAGTLTLDTPIRFGKRDLLPHAPATGPRVKQGVMSVRELCAAAVEQSDNPAANLLLARVDGPPGLTRFLRELGDPVTRLDRTELALNTNLPDDPRDTTTPGAMVSTVHTLLASKRLSPASLDQWIAWLVNVRTGLSRLRAGLPAQWKVGDKTGTGRRGAINDVAIAWPPGRPPIILAAYLSGSSEPTASLERAHAALARIMLAGLAVPA